MMHVEPKKLATSDLSKADAQALTDRIRAAVDGLGSLVERAYDQKAWKAMGYATWEAYVGKEFGFTRQRSYQLLDQGKVAKELAVATGDLSNAFDISARDAAAVKSDLSAVTEEIKKRVEAGEKPTKVVDEVIAKKRAEKEDARKAKAEQQAKNDAIRDQARAALPESIKVQEQAKADAKAHRTEMTILESLEAAKDRIAELEESIWALEKENATLKAKLKVFSEMEAEWTQGGFAKVIEGKEQVIAAQATRIETESRDKASYKRSADMWKKRAEEAGWSNDVVIEV